MKKDNILVLNFEAHKPPTFKEVNGKDWVLYGSEREWRNNYPEFLLDLYNESSIHNSIVNGKARYITGQGWEIIKDLPLQQKIDISNFINDAGSESLKSLTNKIATDKKLFGGFAVQPIWSKDNKTISQLHHVEFKNIRVGVDDGIYYFTKDWSARRPEDNDDFEILSSFTGEPGKDQLIYFKEYRTGLSD